MSVQQIYQKYLKQNDELRQNEIFNSRKLQRYIYLKRPLFLCPGIGIDTNETATPQENIAWTAHSF